jgi:transcriptional regulator with XRE-family HTH domain
MIIAERITQKRQEQGITQSELAGLLLKDRQQVERLERGAHTPNLWTLYEVCRALNYPLSELLKDL